MGGDWVLMDGAMTSKSLIQFSIDEWSYVPSLIFIWGQTIVEVMKIMVTSFKISHACTATLSAPNPAAGHHQPTPLLQTPGHSQGSLGQSLMGVTAPLSWVLMHNILFVPSRSLFSSPV